MLALIGAIILVTFLIVLLVFLLSFALYQSSPMRIGYIPLPERAVPAVVKALNIDGDSMIFDLGCGDGRILAAALDTAPKTSGIGIEYHPMVARLARWRLRRFGKRVRVIRGDLLKQDLSGATHLFSYLNDPTMALLEPKLERELRLGTRLVSCDFKLPNKKPAKTIKIGESKQLGQRLYMYEY